MLPNDQVFRADQSVPVPSQNSSSEPMPRVCLRLETYPPPIKPAHHLHFSDQTLPQIEGSRLHTAYTRQPTKTNFPDTKAPQGVLSTPQKPSIGRWTVFGGRKKNQFGGKFGVVDDFVRR